MLDQCREFWVEKVKETESTTRAIAEAQQQVALDTLISEKLKDLDQNVTLFLDVLKGRWYNAGTRLEAESLRDQHQEWKEVEQSLDLLRNLWEGDNIGRSDWCAWKRNW
jgi:hypothetical protein